MNKFCVLERAILALNDCTSLWTRIMPIKHPFDAWTASAGPANNFRDEPHVFWLRGSGMGAVAQPKTTSDCFCWTPQVELGVKDHKLAVGALWKFNK